MRKETLLDGGGGSAYKGVKRKGNGKGGRSPEALEAWKLQGETKEGRLRGPRTQG